MEPEGRRGHPLALLARSFVVLLVVALALAALAATRNTGGVAPAGPAGAPAARLLFAPRVISTLDAAHLACPSGAAYSPNGAVVAVVGQTGSCEAAAARHGGEQPHVLVIFGAASGQVWSTTPLDPLVEASGLPGGGRTAARAMRFAGLGWSPDGSVYAVAYIAFGRAGSFALGDVVGSGLLLVGAAGGQPRVIRGDAGFFAAPTGSYAGLPIWNLRTGAVTAPLVTPPGLSYSWKGAGSPTGGLAAPVAILPLGAAPLTVLPVGAGPRYPIGDPVGDATFTIWQPALVLGPRVAPAGALANPGDGAFVTSFTSWSPDAGYMTVLVGGVALPWPAGGVADAPAVAAPAAQAPATLTETPARDRALAALEAEVGTAGWALVAWNPDGSLLASVNCAGSGAPTLELRATDTGAVMSQTPLRFGAADPGCRATSYGEPLGAYANPNLQLLWSPDGTSVLLSDQAANSIEQWDVAQS
jgi:hypothetical protein